MDEEAKCALLDRLVDCVNHGWNRNFYLEVDKMIELALQKGRRQERDSGGDNLPGWYGE